MKITTLKYFVSAAELSSFTQAAKQNFVAQTAVSQQIAKLEGELKIQLFNREKNRVTLTEAGQVFYGEVKEILQHYQLAVQKVSRYSEEHKKVITIGYTERHELQLLTRIIREFQKKHPQVEFVIKEEIGTKLIEEIKHGVCDFFVNISCTFSEKDMENLDQYTIYSGNMRLAVSVDHPFAKQDWVDAKQLDGQKIILFNLDNLNRGFDAMYEHCKMDGYEVTSMESAPNIGAQLMLVELNRGVAFVEDLMTNPQKDTIRFLNIHNSAHKYQIDVVWNKEIKDPMVKEFIHHMKRKLPKVQS